MKKSIDLILILLAVLIGSGVCRAATVVPVFAVEGIPPAGFPHFENATRVELNRLNRNSYQLTAVNNGSPFLFQFTPQQAYNITRGNYRLTANFSNSGTFLGGTVSVNGAIPGLGLTRQNLFSATLDECDFNADGTAGPLSLDFRTGNFTGWAAQFGTVESVHLFGAGLQGILNGFSNALLVRGRANAIAITTVPVPAALPLLGSALAGFSLLGKRRMPARA